MENDTHGVTLAIAILLLWLAGLAFFVAFEGSKFLTESTSGSWFGSILGEIANRVTGQSSQSGAAEGDLGSAQAMIDSGSGGGGAMRPE